MEIEGRTFPDRLLVIGAHYDTLKPECPGADDNSTGVAGVLELARRLQASPPKISVILAAFTCEEYPVGGTDRMGSAVFVRRLLEEGRRPVGMISLDMLGYFTDTPGSQGYPAPLHLYYPDQGDFICFVGDATSRGFIREVVRKFRDLPAAIPSQGITAPFRLIPDVLRSDHEYFIRNGMPGVMITDTANFRYKAHYHQPSDTPDKLDFIKMARVVDGICRVIQDYAPPPR